MANHSFCENCGTPIPLGETLCSACANLLQPERKSNKLLIGIIAGVLALIVAAVVIFFVIDPFGSKEETPGSADSETTIQTDVDPAPSEESEPTTAQPTQPMISCIECGASIPETALFCPHCGTTQDESEEAEPEEESEEEPEEEPEPITMQRVDSSDVSTGSLSKVDISSVYGTSTVKQSGNHDNTASVTLDNDLTTSWQEGVDGSGIGEGITYDLDGDHYVEYIAFNLGNWRTHDWYVKNNVPQALDIVINEEIYHISFPYGQTRYWVALSEPVLTDCVEIYIAAAYPGSEYNDTCIAEVGIYGEPA